MSVKTHQGRCLVTGCAGFIGSHLSERLLALGYQVVGVDAFTDYYDRSYKERNIASLESPQFSLVEGDLLFLPLEDLLDGIDLVFHLAAQPGVRLSWGPAFDTYARQNILVTQRLLEGCKRCPISGLVYASSSSVYGNPATLPVTEESSTRPISPYGVTKLAGEQLCRVYHDNFGVPAVILRYFTVYGARQRPDMAFHRFIAAAVEGHATTVYEDGRQTRDFTHVTDAVEATVRAGERDSTRGKVYNIAGGSRVTLNDALECISRIVGRKLHVDHELHQVGDARDTYADITAARRDLDYTPSTSLDRGILDEVRWYREQRLSVVGPVNEPSAAP